MNPGSPTRLAFMCPCRFSLFLQYATLTACTVEENERGYLPAGRIARVVCCGKEGTRKIITGIDGHTVHGQTLRARRLMEVVPGHGEFWTSPWSESGLIGERYMCRCDSLWDWGVELPFSPLLLCSSCHAKAVLRITYKHILCCSDGGSSN